MSENESKRLLIAPLDWGLGHTSRCVPIIKYLLSQGYIVCFAGNQWQCKYVLDCVGPIETVHIDGYNISYGKGKNSLKWNLLKQIPAIFRAIKKENIWLRQLLSQRHFDAVISDNRYGLFNPGVPSYIICHQLQIVSGAGSFIDMILQMLHYRFLNNFKATLVPDVPQSNSLSGKLSHCKFKPLNYRFIGPLSPFSPVGTTKSTKVPLLVMLSGLEPYRQQLSDLLWSQICNLDIYTVFIEGSNIAKPRTNIPKHIQYHLQLSTSQLQPLLASANLVICRSGYSSIMDLTVLGKKAILIPTPGQTEQEYLAKYHLKNGNFLSAPQKGFQLSKYLQFTQEYLNLKPISSKAFIMFHDALNFYL